MSDEEGAHVRRIGDKVQAVAFALCIISAPLSIWLAGKQYGDLPEKMQVMSDAMLDLKYEIAFVKRQNAELIEQRRVEENWRARIVDNEKKLDRTIDRVTAVEKDVEKIKDRPFLFGGGKK